MLRRMLVLPLLAAVALVLGASGVAVAGGGGHGACDGFARGQTLTMRDSCFQGATHFAKPGTVTVRNEGNLVHDIVAVDGSFSSPRLAPGQTFELTRDGVGVVPFYCSIHGTTTGARMAGVLVVGDVATSQEAVLASADGRAATAVAEPDRRDLVAFAVVGGVAVLVAMFALGLTAFVDVRSGGSGRPGRPRP